MTLCCEDLVAMKQTTTLIFLSFEDIINLSLSTLMAIQVRMDLIETLLHWQQRHCQYHCYLKIYNFEFGTLVPWDISNPQYICIKIQVCIHKNFKVKNSKRAKYCHWIQLQT